MSASISPILIIISLFLLVSILASKVSDRFGVPTLIPFLLLGMLAGSDGLGGIYFDDTALTQSIGVVALTLILFSGGLDTEWKSIRPVLKEGLTLATVGVVVTALIVGLVAKLVLGSSLLVGCLLGAIISSTDAAAVFAVLRARNVHLGGRLKSLLELESGSNDPMAVLLTIGFLQLLTQPAAPWTGLVFLFAKQLGLGALIGVVMGKVMQAVTNRVRLGYDGLYPVLTLSMVLLTFSVTDRLGGSGFLAVYIAGLILGNTCVVNRQTLLHFHDGLAWLMQIVLFLTLGLLVFPSRLPPIAGQGLLISACLIFLARPISVFVGLSLSKYTLRERTFVSWVGLRGAVPIVLATFPLLAGLPEADLIFNVVFFVVLTSVLLQGTSIPMVARWLRVDVPAPTEADDAAEACAI